jgi:hypothetical protein
VLWDIKLLIRGEKQIENVFNPEIAEHVQSYENCQCTKDDFECDYGYERADATDENGERTFTGPCVPMTEKPEHINPEAGKECTAGRTVLFETKGYRKAPGNTCLGGAEWAPIEKSCPYFATYSTGKFVVAILIILVLILLFVNCERKFHIINFFTRKWRYWVFGYVDVSTDEDLKYREDEENSSFLNEEEFSASAAEVPEKEGVKKRKESEYKPLPKSSDHRVNIPTLQPPHSSNEEPFDPRE